MLSILTQFYQIDHTLWWTIVGVNWLTLCQSGVPQSSVSCPVFSILCNFELFSILENKLISHPQMVKL